jgi:radical SAM superfamily enzyme YgiQ (UPF0313 family)
MSSEKPRILLCDLTYTQQTISSDVMPAAVGHVASFLIERMDRPVSVAIFKYPETLIDELEHIGPGQEPDVVGFSNYVWNCHLSLAFAEIIKRRYPSVAIVFGGPNLATNPAEQEVFLRSHPVIDFHIVKEGEIAFYLLVDQLVKTGFDKNKVTTLQPNLLFIDREGAFRSSAQVVRTLDLNDIPSPYTRGLMDPFFDGKLLPIIQTNRGCPFQCTFCTEGLSYWTKVYKSKQDKIDGEIMYIAAKMATLGDGSRNDLHIADSNFGMYKEDLDTARTLAKTRDDYGYPQYINVATGKNRKERVLEVAKMVGGAMKLAGSVQSLDEVVLQNIKRSNISVSEIMELAMNAEVIGANSYSEIILGLPGDTIEAHFESLKTIVEAGFNTIAMYQLMILAGTEMGSQESRSEYGMITRYRLLPRCYGYFDVSGEQLNVAEIEEICVANNTLSFDDYLSCRKMNFLVNVFYNDGVFRELLKFFRENHLSNWEWIKLIYEGVGATDRFGELIDLFLGETRDELWEDRAELAAFCAGRTNLQRYIKGEIGGNLMFKYKGMSMTEYLDEVAVVAREAAFELLIRNGRDSQANLAFVSEIVNYNLLRMQDIFRDPPQVREGVFHYDIGRFSQNLAAEPIDGYRLPCAGSVHFEFDEDQIKTLRSFRALFGYSKQGISRILSRVYIRKLFRNARLGERVAQESAKTMLTGQASLSGLNEFE